MAFLPSSPLFVPRKQQQINSKCWIGRNIILYVCRVLYECENGCWRRCWEIDSAPTVCDFLPFTRWMSCLMFEERRRMHHEWGHGRAHSNANLRGSEGIKISACWYHNFVLCIINQFHKSVKSTEKENIIEMKWHFHSDASEDDRGVLGVVSGDQWY